MGLPVENQRTEQRSEQSSETNVLGGQGHPSLTPGRPAELFARELTSESAEFSLLTVVRAVAPVVGLMVLASVALWLSPQSIPASVVAALAALAAGCGVVQIGLTMAAVPWQRFPHFFAVVASLVGVAVAAWVIKLPAEFFTHEAALVCLELAAFSAALLLWLRLRELVVQRLGAATVFNLDALVPSAWKRERPEALETKAPPQALVRGNYFVCRGGDCVPADAVVLHGAVLVEERILSGEAVLRIRGAGDEVYAGSKVIKGEMTAQVISELRDSKITSFLPLLERAAQLPDALFGRLSGPVLWMLPFVAACVALGWHELKGAWAGPLASAGAVLALIALLDLVRILEAIPSMAIRAGFNHGILFQSREALQALGRPKEVVLEQSSEEALFGMRLRELAVLDERIDRARMESALLAIFSRMGAEYVEPFEKARATSVANLLPCQISEYHEYSSMGVAAVVEGAEFSLGSEEFLIARGVRIQPSELVPQREGEFVMYVALGDELVARCVFAEPRLDLLGERLFKQEVELRLMGTVAAETLDNYAKRAGVELALTSGGLSAGEIKERIQALRSPVLFAGTRTEPSIIAAARASVGIFDPIRWDIERTSVTLFSSALETFERCLSVARRARLIATAIGSFGLALAGLLTVLAVGGYVPAVVVLLAAITGICFALLLAESLGRPLSL